MSAVACTSPKATADSGDAGGGAEPADRRALEQAAEEELLEERCAEAEERGEDDQPQPVRVARDVLGLLLDVDVVLEEAEQQRRQR